MGIIKIIKEKNMKSIPSKGKNQWNILKQFNNKKEKYFIEYAKELTKNEPLDKFQQGSWWKREIEWNLERGNIIIMNEKINKSENLTDDEVKIHLKKSTIDVIRDFLIWAGRAVIVVIVFLFLMDWFFSLGIWDIAKLATFDAL